MDRRQFIGTSAAALVGLPALSSPLHALRVPRRFGYAAITWGGNDPAAIEDIAALGFRGIQLRDSAVQRWGAHPEVLQQVLAQRQLTFVALSSGVVSGDPAKEAETIALHVKNAEFLRAAGGMFLQVVDERPRGRAPVPDDYRRMGKLLTEIGKRTMDVGIPLGYHNHMGNLGQSADEVARVLDAADPRFVKLELDIAHYFAAGGDPVHAVSQHAGRLLFLHIKDVRRPASTGAPNSYRFVELGQGSVPIHDVLTALDGISFDGWSIVELDDVSDASRSPKQCGETSKRYLESHGYVL